MSWYLIHTKPHQEARALVNLERQGYVCFMPTLAVERIVGGSRRVAEEPLFSRYLFIRLGAGSQSWAPIRSTMGVSQLVRFGTEAARVDSTVIDFLRRGRAKSVRPAFARGERVLITKGPFGGLKAIYDMPDGERRAMVLIDILGKTARLGVPFGNLQPPD